MFFSTNYERCTKVRKNEEWFRIFRINFNFVFRSVNLYELNPAYLRCVAQSPFSKFDNPGIAPFPFGIFGSDVVVKLESWFF